MFLIATLALLFLVDCGYAQEEPARLLVSKRLLNQHLVENRDITVEYFIVNVGGSAALNVEFSDAGSYPDEQFEGISGFRDIKWDRIVPGANVSHAIIVRAKVAGKIDFKPAVVKYIDSDQTSEAQTAYSSAPGPRFITAAHEFDRLFSPHVIDWATFSAMCLPSLGIPFLLWYQSKSKYNRILRASSATAANKRL